MEYLILVNKADLIKVIKQKLKKQQQQELIDIRYFSKTITKITTLVVDRAFSLSIEVKDDTKETFNEATGLATYSNSESTVLSYASIFESLWMQTELNEQKDSDKL